MGIIIMLLAAAFLIEKDATKPATPEAFVCSGRWSCEGGPKKSSCVCIPGPGEPAGPTIEVKGLEECLDGMCVKAVGKGVFSTVYRRK